MSTPVHDKTKRKLGHCILCGKPTGRDKIAYYCPRCRADKNVEQNKVYAKRNTVYASTRAKNILYLKECGLNVESIKSMTVVAMTNLVKELHEKHGTEWHKFLPATLKAHLSL